MAAVEAIYGIKKKSSTKVLREKNSAVYVLYINIFFSQFEDVSLPQTLIGISEIGQVLFDIVKTDAVKVFSN
jgi:hypothetical protein